MEPDALPYKHPKQIVKNSWRKAFLIKQTNKNRGWGFSGVCILVKMSRERILEWLCKYLADVYLSYLFMERLARSTEITEVTFAWKKDQAK